MIRLVYDTINSEVKVTDDYDKLLFHRNNISEILVKDGYYSVFETLNNDTDSNSVETLRVPIANTIMSIIR